MLAGQAGEQADAGQLVDGGGHVARAHREYRSADGRSSTAGGSARAAASTGEHRGDHFACPACGHVVWANPAPAVQALVERDGRLLLGRRAFDPSVGLWDLPGGFLEENEHPLDALVRELREETGLEIEPQALRRRLDGARLPGADRALPDLGRTRDRRHRACRRTTSSELAWFAPHELPADDELAFRHFPELLGLWRARHEHA